MKKLESVKSKMYALKNVKSIVGGMLGPEKCWEYFYTAAKKAQDKQAQYD